MELDSKKMQQCDNGRSQYLHDHESQNKRLRESEYYSLTSLVAQMVKNLEDQVLISRWGRSPREGNGNPLQCSCLENSMDRGVWQATVHLVAEESDTTKQLFH